MNQRTIILFTAILFISVSFFLFYVSDKNMDPANNKDWWSLSFENPKDNSLDFSVDNFSKVSQFKWEIYADKNKIAEGSVEAVKGEKKNINPGVAGESGKKMTITVYSGEDKKEIYKNF